MAQDTKRALPDEPHTSGISGIYAITPDHLSTESLLNSSRILLQSGVRTIQYRRKLTPAKSQLVEVQNLQSLAETYGAKLIINDNLELALATGAAGVHWGKGDVDCTQVETLARQIDLARERALATGLSAPFLVGVSCYNDFSRASLAVGAGASYVAFGSMFPSSTKPSATSAPISLIRRAKRELDTTVIAIGGITRDNAASLIEAGVDAVAVISDLFAAANDSELAGRVTAFQRLFQIHSATTTEIS